jgi:hypothetical protein
MHEILSLDYIKKKIFVARQMEVMLDHELAELYNVPTKALNQAVKRNIERFPERFMFKLSDEEKKELVTNCDHLQSLKFSPQLPYVFTEQGVAMLSAVLRSSTAIKVSVQIMEAFVAMRKFISGNVEIFNRLDRVELKQIEHEDKFEKVFKAIEDKSIKPSKGIFFDGQVFDAYKFVSDLVEKGRSVVLIDNYIDESVLEMFSNCNEVVIYTKNVSKKLELAVEKFNQQYGKLVLRKFNKSHDRFMIIDKKEVYHFGASLKDLGKKWFAFSKFDKEALEVLSRLK